MSRTTPLLTVVVADSCCTAITRDELGCQSPHPSDACLDATAVGLAVGLTEGLINHKDLLRMGLCHCRAVPPSPLRMISTMTPLATPLTIMDDAKKIPPETLWMLTY